jgi:hypothetical protein
MACGCPQCTGFTLDEPTDDMVLIPRSFLNSAAYAIAYRLDAPKTLEALRKYSRAQHAPAVSITVSTPGHVDEAVLNRFIASGKGGVR